MARHETAVASSADLKPAQRARPIPWLGLSIVLHLAALAALLAVFPSPPEPMAQRKSDQLKQLSAQKLDEAATRLREINREQLEENVEQLQTSLEKLKEMERAQAIEVAAEKSDRPAEAKANAGELIDQILAAQQALGESQRQLTPQLSRAGIALTEAVKHPADQQRITSFDAGEGLTAVKNLAVLEKPIKAANKEIDAIQKLQVRLADELAWLNNPSIVELQKQAISAQERAKGANKQTDARFEWLGRELSELPKKTHSALATDKRNLAYRIDQAHRLINHLDSHASEIANLHQAAIPSQDTAYQAELAVKQALQAAPPPEPLRPEDLSTVADATTQPDGSQADAADTIPADASDSQPPLSQIYEKAVAIEQTMANVNASIRATALSKAAGVAPQTAKATVAAAAPNRPQVDAAALDGDVTSGEGFENYQMQLATVVATSDSMVLSAQRMLDTAAAAIAGQDADAAATIELTATDDPASADSSHGPHGVPGGSDAVSDTPPGLSDTEARAGKGGKAGGEGTGDGRAAADDPETRRRTNIALVRPGRKLAAEGGDQPWTFLDAWYVIGPFTTGNSAGLNQAYSPESVVDLDAVYSGPDGRRLRWRYRKEASPGTFYFPDQAANAVNYAFTFVRAERDMEVWMAIGSDDGAKLWINDQLVDGPVWHGNESAWQFSFGHDNGALSCHLHYRGYRKVRLQQGLNRLLIRVDNGPGGTGFAIYLAPATTATP